MLKLKRVEIQGFKSFCDRTEMRFNGAGLAAVVGPNGCGKSNLSDAISWVLGEQSAKSLRGSRMQDVIFAGTNSRKPLGMAAVTMTLVDPSYHEGPPRISSVNGGGANGQGANGSGANGVGASGHGVHGANGHEPGRPREITITRRLFRSGESEYLIDGRLARLRDIQDLFMGTGLGPESYAIIEQGRIGQILSSRPQDRRAILEEAAGIGKFKARRRLAEAKLEGARQNLARVFDILEEVGRQANSLKRQANKAKRYQTLRAEMIVEMRRVLTGRFHLLEREAAKTALDLNVASTEYQNLSGQVSERELQQSETRKLAYETEAELTAARGRLSELRVQSERTQGRKESQTKQVGGIELRLDQGDGEIRTIEARTIALDEQVETHGRVLAELDVQVEQARESLSAKAGERDRVQGELREHEQGIETLRQDVLRLLGEASALRNELAQVDEYAAAVDRDMARAENERQVATDEAERLGRLGVELAEKLAASRDQAASIAGRRAELERELTSRKEKVAAVRGKREQLQAETSHRRARKQSLDEILSHRAYTTDSVKNFFTAVARSPRWEVEPIGVLADFVEVDPAYEKAAEEFLHDELEYIVVRDWSQADQGIELIRRDLDGRVTFLIHPEADADFGEATEPPPIGPETGIVTRLSSVLRMTNGLTQAPAALIPRLSRCMIAESKHAAQRLAQQYPDSYFLLPDGVCYHGYAVSGGKKSAGGPLALKRELREITPHLERCERELAEAERQLDALESEIGALDRDLEEARSAQQRHEKDVVALESESRKVGEDAGRAASRISAAQAELERMAELRQRAAEQRGKSQISIAEKEEARAVREAELGSARSRTAELQDMAAKLGEEHAALRVDLAEREERKRAELAAKERSERQRDELGERRAAVSAEMERLGTERSGLIADNIELDKLLASLAADIATTDAVVSELNARETGFRQVLAEAEENLKQLRESAQQAQEKRSQIEVTLAERRAELRYLDETARKELNATLDELREGDESAPDEIALAEAEEHLVQLKARIEALGPVNPQALEEYHETQQRYDFLNAQRQDLLDSIRDTEKAIHDIDIESRKRFTHAFERINENFRKLFENLFGGGVGEMRLTDPASLSDSGIDLVASPPGKRLQNVLLLSGGEKALTALALLMAIFQFQPSPFCILDEVDAPLDEPNIRRLLRLLRSMSARTQFIVITHAKATMEVAESLYGVTMQEPGVSKLVSVRFHPLIEQPPPPQVQVAAASQ